MSSIQKKRAFWHLLLGLLVLVIAVRAYFFLTDDFRLGNIQYDLPFHSEWESTPLSSLEQLQLDALLKQPFSYIGKGAQSYVFASADQQYVIKFFKFKHLRPNWLVDLLPSVPPFAAYQKKQTLRKTRKLYGVFNSHKLAYERNRPESGLIFIQLNPSHQSKSFVVLDKLGLERTIDLGEVVFVIQRKGQTLREVLTNLLDQGNLSLAQQRIGQIFDLYLHEYEKGLYDHDHGVMRNIGFIGECAFHLDIGKLLADETMKQPHIHLNDLAKVAAAINTWLQKNYPQYASSLSQYMAARIKDERLL